VSKPVIVVDETGPVKPSTKRTVVLVCASEKKWTQHRFSRVDHRAKDRLVLMFACCNCTEERVYGVEG